MDTNNKALTILSFIVTLGLIALFIFMIIMGINKFKSDDYDVVMDKTEEVTPTVIVTNAPIEVNNTQELLDSLKNDIENIIQCNNIKILSLVTPGLSDTNITGLRAALGQGILSNYTFYKIDETLTTSNDYYDYIMICYITVNNVTKPVYIKFFIVDDRINNLMYEVGEL